MALRLDGHFNFCLILVEKKDKIEPGFDSGSAGQQLSMLIITP